MRRFWFLPLLILLLSCGKEQGDVLTLNSTSPDEEEVEQTPVQYLVIGGQDANHRGIGIYTLDGTFVRMFDFRDEGGTPRGVTPYDNESFLVSVDSTDAIYRVTLDGEKTLFHGSALFNGTQYDIARSPAGNVYAIESNRIEVFDGNGLRMAAFYMAGTIGACTLTTPRGLYFRSDGRLLVADSGGGGKIMVYDLTDPSNPVCDSSVPFANTPDGIIEHSNGNLYITTLGDEQVYRADLDGSNPVAIWTTDTAIIQDPTDILELPNGNLLVSSSVRDTIEEITVDGIRVGTQPFIRDIVSLNTSTMTIVGEAPSEP